MNSLGVWKGFEDNFYISTYRIEKLEFSTWGFFIFAFDFELWQILFSHTLLWGNSNNAVLTN